MGYKYYCKQAILAVVILALTGGVFCLFHFTPWINSEVRYVINKQQSVFITADGLITTSTFAFVAFSSLAPDSSGSSIVIRRLEWKGHWIFRNTYLLSISVLLTIISSFTIKFDSSFMAVSLLISSAIVIFIIIRYDLYYRKANEKAGKRIKKRIKYIIENKKLVDGYKMEKKIKDILRPFTNPLKGSHNVDFIRIIISSDLMMSIFKKRYQNNSNKKNPKELVKYDEENPSRLKFITEKESFIFNRLLLPSRYGVLTLDEKAYLVVTMSKKMAKFISPSGKNNCYEEEAEQVIVLFGYIASNIFFNIDVKNESSEDVKYSVVRMANILYENMLLNKQVEYVSQ